MNDNRRYNRVYESLRWRLGMQITLEMATPNDFAILLLPQFLIGRNNRAPFAIGMEWLFGAINFYVISKAYAKEITTRKNGRKKMADKLGLTTKVYSLRWGWS